MSSGANNTSNQSLVAVQDLLKISVGFAAGCLVFSTGLLSDNIEFTIIPKLLLGWSWIMLAFSIAMGVLAYMRIPILIAENNNDVHDKYMAIPGRIHHVSFIMGIFLLGFTIISVLMSK
jgi:hypothetical protein